MFDEHDTNRLINYRPLFLAAVGSIMGFAVYEAVMGLKLDTALRSVILCAAILSIGALFVYSFLKRNKTAAVLFAAFLLAAARMAAVMPDRIVPGEHELRGTVCAVSETHSNVVTLSHAYIDGSRLRMKVKLTLDCGDIPSVGDVIELKCTVRNPAGASSGYDERHILLSSGISIAAKGLDYETLSRHALPIAEKLVEIKHMLHDRIFDIFGESAPIAAGFLLGEKTGMDEADMESFRQTGTAHILTLSGFHVALITSVLFYLLPKRFPWLRLIIVSLFLIAYCAVTAFTPSLVRASLMCFTMMLADAVQERRDTLSSLSLAAIIILFISPYKLWSAGFRLSFAATFGILAVTVQGYNSGAEGIAGRILQPITATVGATAATMLICAQYFGYFPVYGVLANASAVSLLSPAVAISFAALMIGIPFPAVGRIAAWPARKLILLAMRLLESIKELPYSTLNVISPSSLSVLLMLVLMFALSQYILRPLKKRILIALPLFLLFTASLAGDIIRA